MDWEPPLNIGTCTFLLLLVELDSLWLNTTRMFGFNSTKMEIAMITFVSMLMILWLLEKILKRLWIWSRLFMQWNPLMGLPIITLETITRKTEKVDGTSDARNIWWKQSRELNVCLEFWRNTHIQWKPETNPSLMNLKYRRQRPLKYQMLMGILVWVVTIGRIDLAHSTSLLSQFIAFVLGKDIKVEPSMCLDI